MADSILMNDGSSFILRNDGGQILLNAHVAVGGVDIVGTHAVPLVVRRGLQLIPVEFTFWLKSCIIINIAAQMRFKSTLICPTKSSIKLKASLLVESVSSLKLKSSLLIECIRNKFRIQSPLLTQSRSTFLFRSETKNKKLKKVLLRKLKEFLDEDG